MLLKGDLPYKCCVSYLRRKIVNTGLVFQKRRRPASTTIKVQFLHLLENKGAIYKKMFDRLRDFCLYCNLSIINVPTRIILSSNVIQGLNSFKNLRDRNCP